MLRGWWTSVVLATAGLVVLSLTRFLPGDHGPVVAAASFSSYAAVGYAALLVVLAAGAALGRVRRARGSGVPAARRRVRAGVAVTSVVGLAVHVVVLAPLFVAAAPAGAATASSSPGSGPTVMTTNLEFGAGDAGAVVRAVSRHHVDVVVLEEVTPACLARLEAAGLMALLPHRAGRASTGADGTVVVSRWGLRTLRSLRLANGGYEVRVAGPRPFTLLAAHTMAPVVSPRRWASDLGRLRAAVAAADGPVVLAGDLNATRDHQPFRRVLGAGVRDAGEEAGSGWQPTWPSRWRESWLRPVIAIDHVLVSEELLGVRTWTVEVPHTDHVGLLAELVWSRPS